MNRPALLPCLLAAVLVPLAACEPGDDDHVRSLVDDMVEELNAQNEIGCDCWQELGYASKSGCEDNAILPSQRRCIEDALSRDPAASRERFECLVPLESEYTECLDQRLACDDLASEDACANDYEIGVRECLELPASVRRAYDDCFE